MAEPQLVCFAKVVTVDLIRQGAVAADHRLDHVTPMVHDRASGNRRTPQSERSDQDGNDPGQGQRPKGDHRQWRIKCGGGVQREPPGAEVCVWVGVEAHSEQTVDPGCFRVVEGFLVGPAT